MFSYLCLILPDLLHSTITSLSLYRSYFSPKNRQETLDQNVAGGNVPPKVQGDDERNLNRNY